MRMDKQTVVYLLILNGMPLSNENEWISDAWSGMDKSQKYYIGQKPERKSAYFMIPFI